jgi:hypothetical protein
VLDAQFASYWVAPAGYLAERFELETVGRLDLSRWALEWQAWALNELPDAVDAPPLTDLVVSTDGWLNPLAVRARQPGEVPAPGEFILRRELFTDTAEALFGSDDVEEAPDAALQSVRERFASLEPLQRIALIIGEELRAFGCLLSDELEIAPAGRRHYVLAATGDGIEDDEGANLSLLPLDGEGRGMALLEGESVPPLAPTAG